MEAAADGIGQGFGGGVSACGGGGVGDSVTGIATCCWLGATIGTEFNEGFTSYAL